MYACGPSQGLIQGDLREIQGFVGLRPVKALKSSDMDIEGHPETAF